MPETVADDQLTIHRLTMHVARLEEENATLRTRLQEEGAAEAERDAYRRGWESLRAWCIAEGHDAPVIQAVEAMEPFE